MNNFKPFAETYTEVTIPLDEKVITAFEQSEYSYLLEDFYSANVNSAYDSVYCTLTVSFVLMITDGKFLPTMLHTSLLKSLPKVIYLKYDSTI